MNTQEPRVAGTLWFMLFYDLVIVAAFGQTAHVYSEHATWDVLGFIFLCTIFLYVLWAVSSLEFMTDSRGNIGQRILGLIQIFAVSLVAIALGWESELTVLWGFLGMAVAVFSVGAMSFIRHTSSPVTRFMPYALTTSGVFIFGAVTPAFGILTRTEDSFLIFSVGVAIVTVGALNVLPRALTQEKAVDVEHLQERFGMLLLIILGEAFVVLIEWLGSGHGIPQPLYFFLTIIVVFAIWLLYFPRLASFARPASASKSTALFVAHFSLIFCSSNAVAAYAAQSVLVLSPLQSGWGSDDWTSLPVAGVIASILWLTFLRDQKWSRSATAYSISLVIVMTLAMMGMDDNTQFGGLALALSALVLLAAGVIVNIIERAKSILR